jgi:sec-independent protein translocase protein TatA
MMGDVAKGLKSFKQGMAEDDEGSTSARDPRALPRGRTPIDVTPSAPHREPRRAPRDDRSRLAGRADVRRRYHRARLVASWR